MDRKTRARLGELSDQITQLFLKTTEREPEVLFTELNVIGQREGNWNKASKVAGWVAGLVVFFVIDAQSYDGFPNESVVLAVIFSFAAFAVACVGTLMLGKFVLERQIMDWAGRADRLIQAHNGAIPNAAAMEPTDPPPPQKPGPKPLPPIQKRIFVGLGILGLILLPLGFYIHVGRLVGGGSALILVSALNLFYRPDR